MEIAQKRKSYESVFILYTNEKLCWISYIQIYILYILDIYIILILYHIRYILY